MEALDIRMSMQRNESAGRNYTLHHTKAFIRLRRCSQKLNGRSEDIENRVRTFVEDLCGSMSVA